MTLVPTMKQRLAAPSDLVDLGGIAELKGIKAEGGGLTIGALTTHAEVARSALVKQTIPALAALADGIGDPAVRNRGTIGGSVANNDPAADYPAGLVALDATIQTNKRKIKADDFFKGMFATALEDGEIITAVSFPKPDRAAYAKFPNPASRYAMVGVFVAKTGNNVRVAVTGAGPGVFRVAEMEKGQGRRPQRRHPRQRRVPRPSRHRDGPPRGRRRVARDPSAALPPGGRAAGIRRGRRFSAPGRGVPPFAFSPPCSRLRRP